MIQYSERGVEVIHMQLGTAKGDAVDGAWWSDYPCDIRTYRRVWKKYFSNTFGLIVLHLCDNGHCWEPYHVYLGTYSDNLRDAYASGRMIPPMTRPEVVEKAANSNWGQQRSDEARRNISLGTTRAMAKRRERRV